jgi:hypothetical protein
MATGFRLRWVSARIASVPLGDMRYVRVMSRAFLLTVLLTDSPKLLNIGQY